MENNEMNPMDDLFRSGMDGQETSPPSSTWAQMEALLDAQGPQTKKKKIALWYWAAATLLPFLMFSIWFFGLNSKQNEMVKSDSNSTIQKRGSGIEKRNEEKANVPSLEMEQIKENSSKNGAEVATANLKNIAYNQINSTQNKKFISSDPNLDSAKNENMLQIELGNNLQNLTTKGEIIQRENSKEKDFEIASVEFKPEKRTSFVPDDQVASIEWKKEQKTSLSEKIANIKTGQIKNFPSVAEAKESLFAWLSPQR